MQANHCSRTCRDTHPDDPRVWCDGCCIDEAEDREANMRRWQDSDGAHWLAKIEAHQREAGEGTAEHDAASIGANL